MAQRKITSEDGSQDASPDQGEQEVTTTSSEIPGAFPFPGDTQSGGTRNPAPDFISSNVAEQAKMYGSTIDPATGRTVTLQDLKDRGLVENTTPTLQQDN